MEQLWFNSSKKNNVELFYFKQQKTLLISLLMWLFESQSLLISETFC